MPSKYLDNARELKDAARRVVRHRPLTPYRLGIFCGERLMIVANPYAPDSRGNHLFEDGLSTGVRFHLRDPYYFPGDLK